MALSTQDKRAAKLAIERARLELDDITDDRNIDLAARAARRQAGLDDYKTFVNTYFPHYATAQSAWFHVDAANRILASMRIIEKYRHIKKPTDKEFEEYENAEKKFCFEWHRGAAKSTNTGVILVMWLIAHGLLKCMLYVSCNVDHAISLLSDLRNELQFNERFAADFGAQYNPTNWGEKEFVTQSGVCFMAVGRGQSPRGLKFRYSRPNFILVDDFDDDEIVENPSRVNRALSWLMGGLYGCFDMGRGVMAMVGNRIHKRSILALFAEKAGVYHTQVNALDENGDPSWPEKYTKEEIEALMEGMDSWLDAQREYMNNPISEGKIFLTEYMEDWIETPDWATYDALMLYGDQAFSEKGTGDFKSWALWGRKVGPNGIEYHLLKCYLQKKSIHDWIRWAYDLYQLQPDSVKRKLKIRIESFLNLANCVADFKLIGLEYGFQLPFDLDTPKDGKKIKKSVRIIMSERHWSRRRVKYSIQEKNNKDYKRNREQQIAYDPEKRNPVDDGPDTNAAALELLENYSSGAIYKLGTRRERGGVL